MKCFGCFIIRFHCGNCDCCNKILVDWKQTRRDIKLQLKELDDEIKFYKAEYRRTYKFEKGQKCD